MEGLSTVEDFFHLRERGTDVGTEIRAGVTTFMVMVYIVALNGIIIAGPLQLDRWRWQPAPPWWPG